MSSRVLFRNFMFVTTLVAAFYLSAGFVFSQARGTKSAPGNQFSPEIDRRVEQVASKVVSWRRDFHEHPELSNREARTAKVVADHLTALGLEVKTGVAHTGVVGLLRGGKPGPCVALRADMDALPVVEQTGLPFASKVKAEYNGQQVGVMHACGHDNHTAILMGVAEVLAGMRKDIPGTVKFIFQPAEEGAPAGEEGGAGLMIKEGVLENPRPEAIFGLHVFSESDAGTISYRPGGAMASVGELRITVLGSQTHGAMPWGGVDPIVVSSQIIMGLQTVISRQANLPKAPAVVTIGIIRGGVRS
ncbi:MAG: amidohydrolase, partial [Candidatus Latescibacterota bacterium]